MIILVLPVLLPVVIVLVWLCVRFGSRDRYVPRGFYYVTAAVSGLCLVAYFLWQLTPPEAQDTYEDGTRTGMWMIFLPYNGAFGLLLTLVLAMWPWSRPRESDPDRDQA